LFFIARLSRSVLSYYDQRVILLIFQVSSNCLA